MLCLAAASFPLCISIGMFLSSSITSSISLPDSLKLSVIADSEITETSILVESVKGSVKIKSNCDASIVFPFRQIPVTASLFCSQLISNSLRTSPTVFSSCRVMSSFCPFTKNSIFLYPFYLFPLC